jgi:TonB family protein
MNTDIRGFNHKELSETIMGVFFEARSSGMLKSSFFQVILALISCLVLQAAALGQDVSNFSKTVTVSGTVTDATGDPVPRPYIRVAGNGQKCGLQADSLGAFQINLPPGTYNLTVDADGFGRYVLTDVILQAGKAADLKFSLGIAQCYDCYGLVAEVWPPEAYEFDDPRITPPRVIERPEPEYSELAKLHHIEGKVVLRVVFNRSGRVTQIVSLQSLPYGLKESAIKAARQIKFQPAMLENRAVSSFFKLNYEFSLHKGECHLGSK